MLQALITYTIVALAALWVLWNIILPTSIRQRLRPARLRRQQENCSDDGCSGCNGCGSSSAPQPVKVRWQDRDRRS